MTVEDFTFHPHRKPSHMRRAWVRVFRHLRRRLNHMLLKEYRSLLLHRGKPVRCA